MTFVFIWWKLSFWCCESKTPSSWQSPLTATLWLRSTWTALLENSCSPPLDEVSTSVNTIDGKLMRFASETANCPPTYWPWQRRKREPLGWPVQPTSWRTWSPSPTTTLSVTSPSSIPRWRLTSTRTSRRRFGHAITGPCRRTWTTLTPSVCSEFTAPVANCASFCTSSATTFSPSATTTSCWRCAPISVAAVPWTTTRRTTSGRCSSSWSSTVVGRRLPRRTGTATCTRRWPPPPFTTCRHWWTTTLTTWRRRSSSSWSSATGRSGCTAPCAATRRCSSRCRPLSASVFRRRPRCATELSRTSSRSRTTASCCWSCYSATTRSECRRPTWETSSRRITSFWRCWSTTQRSAMTSR